MIQPRHYRWATGAVYPSGSGSFTGLNNKTSPGATELDRGYVPSGRVPARWENWLRNQDADAVESVLDLALLNWSPRNEISCNALSAQPQSNTRLISARLVQAGDPTDLLVYTDTSNGRIAAAIHSDEDSAFFDIGASGFSSCSNVIAGFNATVPYIIIIDGSGNIKKSTVQGTWVAAGSVSAAAEVGAYRAQNDTWYLTTPGHVFQSSTLANSAWTDSAVTGWTGGPPPSALCMVSSSDGVLLGASGFVVFSASGTPGSFVKTNVTPNLGSVDFSDTDQQWIGTDGADIWTCPAGASGVVWTKVATAPAGTISAVRAFGRGYVLVGTLGIWAAQSPAGPWARLYKSFGTATTDLVLHNGRLLAGEKVSASALFWYVKHTLRAPWLMF